MSVKALDWSPIVCREFRFGAAGFSIRAVSFHVKAETTALIILSGDDQCSRFRES